MATSALAQSTPTTIERARGLLRTAYVALPKAEAFEIDWQELGKPSAKELAAFASRNETLPERIASRAGKGFFSAYDRYRIEQCPIEMNSGPRELQCSLELLGDGYFLESPQLKSELARVAPVAVISDRTTVDIFLPNHAYCPLVLSQHVLRWLNSRSDGDITVIEENGVLTVRTAQKEFRIDIRATDGQILAAEYRMLSGALLQLRYEATLADGVYPAAHPLRSFVSMSDLGNTPLVQENRYSSVTRLREADPRLFQWQRVAPNAFNIVTGKIILPDGSVDDNATRAFLERSQRRAAPTPAPVPVPVPVPTTPTPTPVPPQKPPVQSVQPANNQFPLEWIIGGAGALAILAALGMKVFWRRD